MPCCIDVVGTRCCDMPCRQIQYVWRDVVQQLQRRQVQQFWSGGLQ
jgi:hypothetical protein